METREKTAYISYDNRLMTINTPYNAKFVEELKAGTKSRRWNAEKKAWTVLLTERKEALSIINQFFSVVENNKPNQISLPDNEHKVLPPSTIPLEIKVGDLIDIWTDGACFVNPGPGGYAAIISNSGQRTEIVGGFNRTTNNRMEIMGAIAALETLQVSCKIKIYSDSRYLVDGMSKGWARRWKAKGWVRKQKRVPNWDLWDRLLNLCEKHKVKLIWVKGHNLQAENERCNELAEDKAKHPDLPTDNGYEGLLGRT